MIFVISDPHSEKDQILALEESAYQQYGKRPDSGDILLVCGDLLGKYSHNIPRSTVGAVIRVLRHERSEAEEPLRKRKDDLEFIEWLSTRPYTVLAIHGNHDCTCAIGSLGKKCEIFGGSGRRLSKNLYYLANGECFDLEDGDGNRLRVLALGEASGHLARFGMGLGNYSTRDYLKMSEHALHRAYDVVLSHDGPYSKLGIFAFLYGKNPINEALDQIEKNIVYRQWFYGHHHMRKMGPDNMRCLYKEIVKIDPPIIPTI